MRSQINTHSYEVNTFRSQLARQSRQPAFEFIPMRVLLLEGAPQNRTVDEHILKDLGFEDVEVAFRSGVDEFIPK